MVWLLVEDPSGARRLFKVYLCGVEVESIKQGYRVRGQRVVAVYRRKPVADAFARHED